MSDPLPFPDVHRSNLVILDDTYCVYEDQYGWFLWNYNTGEEETIVLFEPALMWTQYVNLTYSQNVNEYTVKIA